MHGQHAQDEEPALAGRFGEQETVQQGHTGPRTVQQVDQRLVEELGACVEDQPIAGQAGAPKEDRHEDAGDPGQPARAAETVHEKRPPSVQKGSENGQR